MRLEKTSTRKTCTILERIIITHGQRITNELEMYIFQHTNNKRGETEMLITTLGLDVPKASEATIQKLIDCGVLYVGEDNQLHVIDVNKKAPTQPTKAE